jgi:hypothetical protein
VTVTAHLVRDPQAGSPLDKYAANLTSQFGEDGIIGRLVELLNPPRYFVEFGAWDGVLYSNCHALARTGWAGLMIEADQAKFPALVANYIGSPVSTVCRRVGFDGPDRLDYVLKENDAPTDIGVMSIDVDGADFYIWQSLNLFKPEIIVIEFNPTVPNDVIFVQEQSLDVNQCCSPLALVLLGDVKGYELVACTMTNAVFVREDKFPLVGISDNSLGTFYRPRRDGRIFYGYDGAIHVVGMPDMMWHGGRKLTSDDFQVLPKEKRGYPPK